MISTIIKTTLITFLVFITPIKGLVCLISFAVVFDTIFAIYVAIKKKGISAFKSTKLFNIVVKTFLYMSTILFAFLVDTYIFEKKLFDISYLVSKTITFVWLYLEIKSIDETSMRLGNRSFWVIFKDLILKAKDLKKDINEIKE